jgi:DNA polymerase-4
LSAQPITIIHIDMDAFYASVEQRDRPELRGQPVAVGGRPPRGVVAAASYEARRFGVHSALPMGTALRRCPQLVCVRPRMGVYQAESKRIFEIFRAFTPDVEGLSLDEAFLDVTASLRLWPNFHDMARQIKKRISEETGLSCSIGIAPNKLVAKIASDLDKPDGLVAVAPDEVYGFLEPLPAAVLPGLGPKAQARLATLGVESIADLRKLDPLVLKHALGNGASRYLELAAGRDRRPVGRRADRSLSAERTFEQDLTERHAVYRELASLADKVAGRLRARGLVAGVVVLKLRRADFRTATRQAALHRRGNETLAILKRSRSLLDSWLAEHPGEPLRLLGIGVKDLGQVQQGSLLEEPAGAAITPLDRATDEIRQRFGTPALTRARTLSEPSATARRDEG